MIISGLSAAASADLAPRRPAPEAVTDATPVVTGTALVPLASPAWRQASSPIRADASFVAHLIATAMQMPQTRPLRRLNPSDAGAAYTGRAAAQPRHGRIVIHTA